MMIQAVFTRNEAGQLVSFSLSGHADAGDYGTDIVCAAVSALAISTTNGIEALAGFKPGTDVNEEQGGYLSVAVIEDITQEQTNIAQILLENLLLALQQMEEEHPENIHVKTQQSQ